MPRKKRSAEELLALELASPEAFEAALKKVLRVSKEQSDKQLIEHKAGSHERRARNDERNAKD